MFLSDTPKNDEVYEDDIAKLIALEEADEEYDEEVEEKLLQPIPGIEIVLTHRPNLRETKETRWIGLAYGDKPSTDIEIFTVEWTHVAKDVKASLTLEESKEVSVALDEEFITPADHPPGTVFLIRSDCLLYGANDDSASNKGLITFGIVDGFKGVEVQVAINIPIQESRRWISCPSSPPRMTV